MSRTRPKPAKAHGRLPSDPVILGSILAGVFEELNVGAAFHTDDTSNAFEEWYPVHIGPSHIALEVQLGVDTRRWRYNRRGFELAHRAQKPVLTSHGGYYDFFVPFGRQHDADITLVVGPFATSRPKATEVLARWREIGGGHGRLADPSFMRYLNETRDMLTLEEPLLRDLERLLGCFAALAGNEGAPDKLAREVHRLMPRLAASRNVERMWQMARVITDDTREWSVAVDAQQLRNLGFTRVPEVALVGLISSRRDKPDPVDDILRRDALVRRCSGFARGKMIPGRLGDHGLVLLVDSGRGRPRDVAEKVGSLAKPFGFELCFGSAGGPGPATALKYRAALAAAEQALATGVLLVPAKPQPEIVSGALGALRRKLRSAASEAPSLLLASFQRYADLATARAGYRLAAVRAHLEAGFDDITQALESAGILDVKAFRELQATVEEEGARAETVNELWEAYRRAVSAVERSIAAPRVARRERSLERAIAYVRDHVGERLSRAKVARIAGLAEHYFSKRFHESEGTTFHDYVTGLRLERSKHMLRSTSLSVERVAELSGFGTRVQFHRSFKRAVGMTPSAFRERPN